MADKLDISFQRKHLKAACYWMRRVIVPAEVTQLFLRQYELQCAHRKL